MRWTIFAFALRVPLSCALTLALLAPLGAFSFSSMRGMLEGLFDVSGPGRLLSRDGLLALLSLLTRIYRVSANGPEVLAGSAIGFAASLLGRLAR